MKKGSPAKIRSSWGEEKSRSEQEGDTVEVSPSASTANDDEVTGTTRRNINADLILLLRYPRQGYVFFVL